MSNDCEPRRMVLAEGPSCRVEECGCGTVHVSLGPFTVRLHHDTLESIWLTLGEALGRTTIGGGSRSARRTNGDRVS